MSNAFLGSLREKRESKTSMIESIVERAAEEVRDLTEVELVNVEALSTEVKKLDERIEQISDIELRNSKAADLAAKVDANAPKAEKRSTPDSSISFSASLSSASLCSIARTSSSDALKAQFGGDSEARDRIQRHQNEMAVELRAASTSSFDGLVVPQYLVDLYAPLARAGRPFADAARKHIMPAQSIEAR